MSEIEYYGDVKKPLIITIKDFYTKNELDGIWQELNFLTYCHKLLPASKTNSATSNNQLLKHNNGLFLETAYSDLNVSNILQITQNIFETSLLDFLENHDPIFRYLKICNKRSSLLSYYENGDYYKSHFDVSAFTVLSFFFEEPKKFTGGDLIFKDFDLKIEVENNMLILFPSCYFHEVTKVEMEGEKFNKKGRYCLSQFLSTE